MRMDNVTQGVDVWPALPARVVSLSIAQPLTPEALQALPALRMYSGPVSPDPALDLGQLTYLNVSGAFLLTPAHASTCRELDQLLGATEAFAEALPAATKARMRWLGIPEVVGAATLAPFESLTYLSVTWLGEDTEELPPRLRTLDLQHNRPDMLPRGCSSPMRIAEIINRCPSLTSLQLNTLAKSHDAPPLQMWLAPFRDAGAVMPNVRSLGGTSLTERRASWDMVREVFPNLADAPVAGGGARRARRKTRRSGSRGQPRSSRGQPRTIVTRKA